MADDTPPQKRPPVKMGLRVVARHSAGRHGGRALAREVAEARAPKHLAASTRLSRHPDEDAAPETYAPVAAPAPPAPPVVAREAAAPAAPPAPAPPRLLRSRRAGRGRCRSRREHARLGRRPA